MKKKLDYQTTNNQQLTTILVTGANGQLGMTIRKMEANYPLIEFIFTSSSELDITTQSKVNEIFKKYRPLYCINCAAYTNVEQAEKEPKQAYAVNAEGVKNLALACKENDTILIHISTDYVFDGEKTEPYTVNDIPNPINEYGKSKLAGERIIKEILEKYFIVRTSWLYSKEFGNNFYRTILKKAKEEKELYVPDSQRGCPTNAENLVYYLFKLIKENIKEFGIKHYSDAEEMTWFDFANKIIDENNLKKSAKIVKTENYRTFARRPNYSVLKN